MSSMKKNILAVALVAGLAVAGGAAAYQYGTSTTTAPALGGNVDLATAEDVAVQQIFDETTVYTMKQNVQFIVNPGDTTTTGDYIIGRTTGFTFRMQLQEFGALYACTPNNDPGASTSGPVLSPVCGPGTVIVMGNQPALNDWEAYVEAGGANANYINIRVQPKSTLTGPPAGLPDGVILAINELQIKNIAEMRAVGLTLNAKYEIGEPVTGGVYPGSQKTVPLLRSVDAFVCNTVLPNEVDKYIDVADLWTTQTKPKTRFSFDGRLGSSGNGNSAQNQHINFGNLTIDIANAPATSATFMTTDHFSTVLAGGAGDNFDAFDNSPVPFTDDIYFTNGSCTSGTVLARSTINPGSAVATFDYTFGQLGGIDGQTSLTVTVCGYVDTNVIIDDTNITHTTKWLDRGGVGVSQGNLAKTCAFPPLRYNGSTMEIFYINPASNTSQRSLIRLTNRSNTAGWVRLEGIDDSGVKAVKQASVLVPAGASVQVTAAELEMGSTKVIGGWGAGAAKWRAVVTAEFPGLVASSFVRNVVGDILTNVTDVDTRGEQKLNDAAEAVASTPGLRPSDFAQETSPDFHGDGQNDGPLGGPNDGSVPTGGSTNPNVPQGGGVPVPGGNAPGNPGL